MRRWAPAPLHQPRLRGQHPGDGRRLGCRRGLRPVVQQRAPRDGREVAGLDRGLRARARGRGAVRRRRPKRPASCSSATRPRPSTSSRPRFRRTRGCSRPRSSTTRTCSRGAATTCTCCRSRRRPTSCSTVTAQALKDTPIDLLAVTGASNVTGEVWPLARTRDAGPRPRRAAVRRRRPARAAPRAEDGRDRDRPPRDLRSQALRAVRRRCAHQPDAAERRAAAARRRRDQARHARRRRLGRRARPLRGRLAERDRRGRARRRLRDARGDRDGRARRPGTSALRAPGPRPERRSPASSGSSSGRDTRTASASRASRWPATRPRRSPPD